MGPWRGTSPRPVAFDVMEIDLHDLSAHGSRQRLSLPTADPDTARRAPPRHRSTVPVGSTTRQAPPPTPRAPAIRTPASCPRPTPCSNSWDSARRTSIRSLGRSHISAARRSWHQAFAAGSTSSSSRPSTPRRPHVGWLSTSPRRWAQPSRSSGRTWTPHADDNDAPLFPALRFGMLRRCPRPHRDPP